MFNIGCHPSGAWSQAVELGDLESCDRMIMGE